ncbi:MAG: PfkB family carbohydrate kinase [Acidobacteriota bacterium]
MHSADQRWDVVGVGASCVDLVCRLPFFPEARTARDKVRVSEQRRACGGQTATALATCASLGLRANYVGAIGDDEDGATVLAELAGRGIGTDDVRVVQCPTATAILLIDDAGERIVLWHRNPDLVLGPDAPMERIISQARLVHVDDVDEEASLWAARLAGERGIPVTCDIDHVTHRTPELLSLVSLPILAEHVPSALTGVADLDCALHALGRDRRQPVIVTLGRRGAIALNEGAIVSSPSFHVRAADTTGAGDVFRGAFIVACLGGRELHDALRFANAAAAVACTRVGAMAGVPALEEVGALLRI